MKNKVLKVFESNNYITMIVKYDGEFFGWQIDNFSWSDFWGNDTPVNLTNCDKFANNDYNTNVGYSEGTFDNEWEVLQAFNLLDGRNKEDNKIIEDNNLVEEMLNLNDFFEYETSDKDGEIIVNSVSYPYEITLSDEIPDSLACRVLINGLYYHFG